MSPLRSIELILDDDLDASVRREWMLLAEAGLSSQGASTSPTNIPHITLLVGPRLEPRTRTDVAALLPVAVELDEPDVFPHGDRGVLMRPVLGGADFIVLRENLISSLARGEREGLIAEDWRPHVTLGRRLRMDQLAQARALVGGALRGSVVGLRLWDPESASVSRIA